MISRILHWVAGAFVVALPLAAYGQSAAVPGGATLVLPNANGTILYRGTGATTTESGGVTVFHGTGPAATVTIEGNRAPDGNR